MNQKQCVSREVLRAATRWQGATVLVARSSIGPLDQNDVGMFLQDSALLARVGVEVVLVERGDLPFWDRQRVPAELEYIGVRGSRELVELAADRKAQKLCLLSGTDQVIASDGRHLDDVSLSEARNLLQEGALSTRQSKETVDLAVAACEAGVPRVHILNMHRDGALLDELFTDLGAGTMIHTDPRHKEVRQMADAEMSAVCTILREVIPRRTAEFVKEHAKELRVFTIDSAIYGVARLTASGEELIVRTIAYSPKANAAETIAALLKAAMREAAELKQERVVVPMDEIPARMRLLTWFHDLGFAKGASAAHGAIDVWSKKLG